MLMRLKRVRAFLLVVVMVLGIMPVHEAKADDKRSSYGDVKSSTSTSVLKKGEVKKSGGYTYKVTKYVEPEYSVGGVKLMKAKKGKKTVRLDNAVNLNERYYIITAIADGVFKNDKKLKKITIGSALESLYGFGIKKIGKNAFRGCKSLKTIDLHEARWLKSIGKNAFKGVPKSATAIVSKKYKKKQKKILRRAGFKGKYKVEASLNDDDSSSAGDGSFSKYSGPILPLTMLEKDEDIKATRSTELSFTEIDGEATSQYGDVMDNYVITNTSDKEKRISFAYPFISELKAGDSVDLVPRISVDGRDTDVRLKAGPSPNLFEDFEGNVITDGSDGKSINIHDITDWDDYRTLLDEGYQDKTFDAIYDGDMSVKIYELSDMYCDDDKLEAATLEISYKPTKGAKVIAWNYNGGGICDDGRETYSVFINEHGGTKSSYLMVINGDIENPEIKAYTDGGCETEIENAGGKLTSYKSTLRETIKKLVNGAHWNAPYYYLKGISEDDYVDLITEYVKETTIDRNVVRYDFLADEAIIDANYVKRIIYACTDVTIPAGKSVMISATMKKEASCNYGDYDNPLYGYDIIPAYGSKLQITGQDFTLKKPESVSVGDQNMCMDMDQGIDKMELDLSCERYYINLKEKK